MAIGNGRGGGAPRSPGIEAKIVVRLVIDETRPILDMIT